MTGRESQVELVPYDGAWVGRFLQSREELKRAIGEIALRIDHVGSTAVEGMVAKPVIDIQVSVKSLSSKAFEQPLNVLGYKYYPFKNFEAYLFFGKPVPPSRDVHIHVCEQSSEEEKIHLAFRDYLRSHPNEAENYSKLKQRIVDSVRGDRSKYIQMKHLFVQELTRKAREHYSTRFAD